MPSLFQKLRLSGAGNHSPRFILIIITIIVNRLIWLKVHLHVRNRSSLRKILLCLFPKVLKRLALRNSKSVTVLPDERGLGQGS